MIKKYCKLQEVVNITPSKKQLSNNVWLLNLDMIEQQSGKIIQYHFVEKNSINSSTIQFDTDTVLYSKLRPNLNKVVLPDKDGYATSEILPLKPDLSVLIKEYLVYFLRSSYFVNYICTKVSGAKMPRASRKELLNSIIPLPPLDEQKRIAAILDKATELITLRKQQIEQLDLLVKSRFVEMFGNPATNSMKWDTPYLSDCLLSIDNGKSFVCENYCRTGDYPAVLKLSAATYGYYNPEENKAVISPKLFITKAEVHAGDLLFTRKNTPDLVGMCAYIFTTPPKLMMPDLIFRLNTKANCNKIFLCQLINLGLFRPRVQSLSGGSAKSMSNISKERLGKMRIPLPPLPLQNEFASFVNHIEKIKSTLQQSLEKLELNYKALMQTYFG